MSSEALLIVLLLMLLLLAATNMVWHSNASTAHTPSRKCSNRNTNSSKSVNAAAKQHRKPDWIRQDILRLKAFLPKNTGVRQIAAIFNRVQAGKSSSGQVSPWRVSKSYVANLLRDQQLEVLRIRSQVRLRHPGVGLIRQTWGIDLTGKMDQSGVLHNILGIIDHGSRMLLALLVSSKHSVILANQLHQTGSVYGLPKYIRTDNERCFTSHTFKGLLQSQGIRLQHTELHCTWQNGRIERLFGSLKQQLKFIQIENAAHLQVWLDEFKHWYNTIRLHQHLAYQTPQEVWRQQEVATNSNQTKSASTLWWTGWSSKLSGVQWRC
jgi:putative transposase